MKRIDGIILKQMIISGANNLYNCYQEVDALNVFPVPDGDTGTNMNLTMSSGLKEVANKNDKSIYEIAKAFSRGLLMGARGNSGVILSQIFRGFSQGLKGKESVDALELADAFMVGREVAYKAVMRPVEGTILTVIRESATALADYVKSDMSITDAMDYLYKEAKASLKRTPDLLPVLKEVGVVDSGGAGLCKILEGFLKALKNEIVEKNMPEVLDADQPLEQGAAQAKLEHQEFGYCTEFILRLPPEDKLGGKKTFIESRFKAILNAHGNSIVEVRDEDLVKVHIHTMVPGNIISFAQQYGEFVKLKIENMSEQHSELIEENTKEEPKLEVKEKKKYGLISVCAGKGIEEIFKSQRVDYLVSGGQTMNPATEDFVKAIKEVNAENVFIFPNNSNIIMAATQAKDVVEGVNVIVIPTKTIPQGIVASMMFNPIVEAEENEAEMNEALANVKTGQVTYSIKDTSVDGVEVKKDEFMSIVEKKIISCNPSKVEAAKKVVEGMVDAFSSIITVLVGEDVTKEEKEELSAALNASYAEDGIEIEVKDGLQPVYSFIISVE
ncbi:MAG: DAK2 domain-containing protein [Bacilli bacterium]|nr:DAK2 domain-containing protein [Bacilli bacterium]